MRLRVLLGAVVLAGLVGAANNAVNPHHLAWIGSPRVIDEPLDLDREPHLTGLVKGVKYAWNLLRRHAIPIGAGGAAAIALSVPWRVLRRPRWTEILETWFRWGTAAMFAAACWYKLADPPAFATAVAQYRMLPAALVNPFALWLPALEAVVAIGLVSGLFEREIYALTTLLWAMFIAALGQALWRRLGITCGCFAIADVYGSVGETWFSLLRDVALLLPTLWLTLRARPRSSPLAYPA
ncbi:MAG: MauE/DoxX family redox-associated membrane protein [Myxococcales bacterium]